MVKINNSYETDLSTGSSVSGFFFFQFHFEAEENDKIQK